MKRGREIKKHFQTTFDTLLPKRGHAYPTLLKTIGATKQSNSKTIVNDVESSFSLFFSGITWLKIKEQKNHPQRKKPKKKNSIDSIV